MPVPLSVWDRHPNIFFTPCEEKNWIPNPLPQMSKKTSGGIRLDVYKGGELENPL